MRRTVGYTADLVEWYRIVPDDPLRRQFLGQCLQSGCFITSNKDFWQRRRDLQVLQLNVVTVEVTVSFEVELLFYDGLWPAREGWEGRSRGEKQSSELRYRLTEEEMTV